MAQPLFSDKFSRQVRDMIAFGAVKNWTKVRKFGHNADLGTSIEDIWSAGGVYSYLTSATLLEVVSSSANDTSGGSGAQTVVIEGLDANFKTISETVTLSGATPVPTVNSYIRVHRAYVVNVGTYGIGSAGDITIRVVSAGATQALIQRTTADTVVWDYGQSQISRYCVPAGCTAFLSEIHVQCESSKRADFAFFQRQNADDVTTPFTGRRLLLSFEGVTGSIEENFEAPIFFPEKTDIITQARLSSGANGRVNCHFTLFVGPTAELSV